jgi:hypothetical protein
MSTGPRPWSPWLRNWWPPKFQEPVVLDHRARRTLAGLQRRQRHEGLVGGARWVSATQGTVEQRLVDRLVEHLPALAVDAIHEQVGVEGGLADKGQHLAGAGVQRNQRATALAKQVFHQLLQLDVDRQHHGVARGGGVLCQLAHRAAAGRRLHLLDTGGAMQLLLERSAPRPACRCTRCPGSWPVLVDFLEALLLGAVDASDVPDDMTGQFAPGIVAEQPGLDLDAGKR